MQMCDFLRAVKHIRYSRNSLITHLNIEVIRETGKNNYKCVYMNIKLFEKFVAEVNRDLNRVAFLATYCN